MTQKIAGDAGRAGMGSFNLDGALNLHCGALSVVVESPSHGFSSVNGFGKTVVMTPDMIVDAQIICHREAIKFLVETGGRSVWTPSLNR